MNKLTRLLLTVGVLAAILWLLRDKIVPPPQPPVAHPPSFRQPPPPSEVIGGDAELETVGTTATDVSAVPDVSDASDNLEDVKGIGPVYRERLAAIGITSFGQLAAADAAAVAEQLEVPEDQVADWADQAAKLG